MTKQLMYPYGKFYDADLEKQPGEGNYDVIVYHNIEGESRVIGSLEGIFVSSIAVAGQNPLVTRDEMQEFEKKYKGRFIPFGKMENKK